MGQSQFRNGVGQAVDLPYPNLPPYPPMKLWKEGNLNELVLEGRTIQNHLPQNNLFKRKEDIARTFAKLLFEGKTKAALQLITSQENEWWLHLDDVIDTSNKDSPHLQ